MLPVVRQRSLRALHASRPRDFATCREVEAACHATATTVEEYDALVRRAAFNLWQNPAVGVDVVHATDAALTQGTLLGRIEAESRAREERFQQMLQEKYDALNDRKFQTMVRCRRCGGEELTWDEKQTRSADEAGTVFISCVTCKHRWVMR